MEPNLYIFILMRDIKTFILIIILSSVSFCSYPEDLGAFISPDALKNVNKTAPIVVNGDKVEYSSDAKTITASGNVSVNYNEVTLTCEKIIVHTDTQLGICDGNVVITQPGTTFKGERIEYNFALKTGKIVTGRISSDPIYGYAEDAEKVSDKEVILRKGYVTTCDLEHPHYRVSARRIRLYLDDKVVAEDVVLYIGDVPVFYLPYYIQPLADLKTKITVTPGYRDEWGYYALTAYRYYINEQFKGYLQLDYRTKKGIAGGIDNKYDFGKLGDGNVKFYYMQENDVTAMDKSGEPLDERYRFAYKHKIDLPAETTGTMEFNKLSDADIIKDYFFNELDEGWVPDNYISLITRQENFSFELMGRKRFDDFYNVVERLPQAHLEIYSQQLWDTKFYYYNDIQAANLLKRYSNDENIEDEYSYRFNTYNKFFYAAKVFKALYVTPYIATTQTYYSKNRWDDLNVWRQIYEYGVDLSLTFFKVYDYESSTADLHKIRHVVNPVIGYHRRPQPTVSAENLIQFDSIDAYETESVITMSLENKLQTKRKSGDLMKSVDIVRFIVSTEYQERLKKRSLASKGDGRFEDVNLDFEFRPYDWLFAKSDITLYTKKGEGEIVKTANTDLVYNLKDKFDLGMGHRYENSSNGSASQFTVESHYKLNKDWSFRVYERFDAHLKEWQEQEYTVYKDLHCWLAEFNFNIRDGFAFWVVFRLKAFPEIPIGFERSYRRPSPGAA